MIDDEIVRIAVLFENKKTSISLDGMLANYMVRRLGDIDALRLWAKSTVAHLETTWNQQAAHTAAGDSVKANMGLSRAVQREAFRLLLETPQPVAAAAVAPQPVAPEYDIGSFAPPASFPTPVSPIIHG